MMNQLMSPLKSMMNSVSQAGNPMMMLNTMAQSNPMLRQALDYVNANGGDARAAFYKLAQERGADPNEILKMLK